MNERSDQRDAATATAQRELARLNGQVEAMRAVLVGLLQDVVRAETQLDNGQALRLLEANEQLVVSAMDAQAEAETSAGALDEVTRLADLDPLTGLPNRALLRDRLLNAIANARRRGNRVALLFLDINDFKLINDTFGHAAGDRALQTVADCLSSVVRETDTVSRHGGDEFLILLAEISHAVDAGLIAEKVNAALGTHSRIDDHAVSLAASIGISIYPEDGEDADTLIDRADAAMYRAKKRPFGGFEFHLKQPPDQPGLAAPALSPPPRRLTHHELTLAEHEQRHAQLREANEQLVLAALGAQQLQAAAEEMRSRHAALLVDLARELGNPFAPIRLAAAVLGRPGIDRELLPRAQAIVAQQMDQMSRRVGELLQPGHVGGSTWTPEKRRFDVCTIAAGVARACRPAIDQRLQTLELQIPSTPIEMLGDADLVAQVLDNLLGNATTYTPHGGRIRLGLALAGKTVVMTVSDNGAGIVPAALATIFDPFVRDPRASAANEAGLGIGLTVVRSVVEAHGGTVTATSGGINQGSEFTVSLPVAE
jgi:diguanylate cyclase (GGDEF)-like protein